MKKLSFLIALVLFSINTYAQDNEVKMGTDGKFWNKLNQFEKLIHVKGVYSGIFWGNSPRKDEFFTKTSLDHIIRGLDSFYEDYRNEKIIAVYAIRIVYREIRGDSPSEIKKMILRFRKFFWRCKIAYQVAEKVLAKRLLFCQFLSQFVRA